MTIIPAALYQVAVLPLLTAVAAESVKARSGLWDTSRKIAFVNRQNVTVPFEKVCSWLTHLYKNVKTGKISTHFIRICCRLCIFFLQQLNFAFYMKNIKNTKRKKDTVFNPTMSTSAFVFPFYYIFITSTGFGNSLAFGFPIQNPANVRPSRFSSQEMQYPSACRELLLLCPLLQMDSAVNTINCT